MRSVTDSELDAFYYARVLKIPTPRWSTYDAVRFGVELPEEVPATLQERCLQLPHPVRDRKLNFQKPFGKKKSPVERHEVL